MAEGRVGLQEIAVRLLDGVRADVDGREVDLGSAGPRSLFALLALRANTTVSRDELIDGLWGEHPPKTADGNIYSYVSNIRKVLEPGRKRTEYSVLLRSSAGYQLVLPASALDVKRFEAAVNQARTLERAGDFQGVLLHCDSALALWTGRALAGAVGPLVEAERDRLSLRKLEVQELRCAALLETGSTLAAAAELTTLTSEHVLNERLHELLMLALYRSGRQGDALALYQQIRARVVEELGIEPGSGLRQLHQRIVAGDSELAEPARPAATVAAAARPRVVPAQLPHGVANLCGREDELNRLRQLCAPAIDGSATGSVIISAIDGIGGVGKTALALQLAHDVAEHFPDGQLFIDLRGFDPKSPPLAPAEALAHLLRDLGAVEAKASAELEELSALYRSTLARRRVLLLLDNAVSPEQVRPLLPGTSGCLALVTSRNRLSGLVARDGAARVTLDVLGAEGSEELLRAVLGDDHVDADSAAARELAERCGHLPLALRIAAERIASGDYFELSEMVEELHAQQDRLDALSIPDDPLATVRAVFSWSYHALKPEDARAFRLLGLYPAQAISSQVAAVLFGTNQPTAKKLLDSMERRSLLRRVGNNRYRLHDLLRTYAGECAELDESPDSSAAATERVLRWYRSSSVVAREVLLPQLVGADDTPSDPDHPPVRLVSYLDAVQWASAELSTIEELVRQAVETGQDEPAVSLANVVGTLYHCTSRWTEWLRVAETAQVAAIRLGDVLSRGRLHNDATTANDFMGQPDEAMRHHVRAIEMFDLVPDRDDPVLIGNLGMAYAFLGQQMESLEALETGLKAVQGFGNRLAHGNLLDKLCSVLSRRGDHDAALEHGYRAVTLLRELNAEYPTGTALDTLGAACSQAERYDEAIAHHQEALNMWRALGDRLNEGSAMLAIAQAQYRTGRTVGLRGPLLEALGILRDCVPTKATEKKIEAIRGLLEQLPSEDR